jgi:glucose/arabinose dehydrogenase
MSVRRGVGSAAQLLRVRAVFVLGVVALAAILLALLSPIRAHAVATVPAGFQESVVFSGLTNPANVEFSKDGRVFVAEKGGLIKVFDNLSDTTPTTFADLRTNVYNFWDRGLLGLALDPNFPTNPYVYVLYTHDAQIGGTAPKWGTAGADSDTCPTPPGATGDGCVVSGRLSRLQADIDTNKMTGNEQVLLED